MRLEWKDILAVDGGELDRDHKRLFDLYNRYAELPEREVDKATMVREFSEAAQRHFHHEQDYLIEKDFSPQDLQAHAGKRARFTSRLKSLTDASVTEILECFQECLRWHVLNENRPIRLFEKSQ